MKKRKKTVLVRISEELRKELHETARENGRTLLGEIDARIKQGAKTRSE